MDIFFQTKLSAKTLSFKQPGVKGLIVLVIALVLNGCALVEKNCMGIFFCQQKLTQSIEHPYATLRNGLSNSFNQFSHKDSARVAFIGGSITYNWGWRNMVMDFLIERFPDTKFEFISAGIPSTGSTPGAFRLERDILNKGAIDLLFIDSAVNDQANGRTAQEQIRGMEGIVRHARINNPNLDIIMMHFVDPKKMELYNSGTTPGVIVQHEKVAAHYGVTTLNLAKEVTERINRQEFTWKDDFKDLHPSKFGQGVYFNSISLLLEQAWQLKTQVYRPHSLPKRPLDFHSYYTAKLVSIDKAQNLTGFKINQNWQPHSSERTRKGFVNVPMLVSNDNSDSFQFNFDGKGIGLWVVAGPDAGDIEYSIDGKKGYLKLPTKWSGKLHLPWAYMLDTELSSGPHTLIVKNASKSNKKAVRIVNFLVNH